MPIFKFPISFSTVKLKLGHSFSQYIKEMENWDFKKPRLHLQVFLNSLNSLKNEIFEIPLPSSFIR